MYNFKEKLYGETLLQFMDDSGNLLRTQWELVEIVDAEHMRRDDPTIDANQRIMKVW